MNYNKHNLFFTDKIFFYNFVDITQLRDHQIASGFLLTTWGEICRSLGYNTFFILLDFWDD